MFPVGNGLKQGEALTPLLFIFDLECAVRRVKINQDGSQLNFTHQLLVYAGYVNTLGGRAHIMEENTEVLILSRKEIGLEINADKAKYMVLYRDQNAGTSHNMKIHNRSFEMVKELKYLGTN